MASDQQCSSKMVLQTLMEVRRQGVTAALEHLERIEPHLAEYVMETLSVIHQKLLALGAPARKTQLVYRHVQLLVLVCLQSLRRGHHELWRQQMGEGLKQLDPSADEPNSSDSSDSPD